MSKELLPLVIKEYVGHVSLSEIDFDLLDNLQVSVERQEQKTGEYYDPEQGWAGDAQPLHIETVQELLDEFKKKGATHIEFLTDPDSEGYQVYGVKIQVGTPEQQQEFAETQKEQRRKEREERINELMDEIERIRKDN